MTQFEETLQKIIAPRLKTFGYQYDANLRSGDELFAFRKKLEGVVSALVQFQWRSGPTHDAFTINLLRVKSAQLQPRAYGGYPDALGARLTHVLWYVHQLRSYPAAEHWWVAEGPAGLADNLMDAMNQIEQYGLGWIENPYPPKPWEMPEYPVNQFMDALNQIVAPALDRLGYRSEIYRLKGGFPYPYFVKSNGDRRYSIIEFQQLYSLDPEEFIFDVRLQQQATPDPLGYSGDYRHWRNASLGQLAWQASGSTARLNSLAALQALLWHYADRAELADRLRDALNKLKQYGLPWLGQSDVQASVIQ